MLPLKKRWKINLPLSEEAARLLDGYPAVLRQILFNRGYTYPDDARRFLEAAELQGTDPFLLKGMPEAVDRLATALRNHEKIAIYGDYDADGVTATALLVQVIRDLRGEVLGYIPNRFDEGYGLNTEALDHLHDSGVHVVVTVDCGVRSLPEAEHASRIGLDLIISDHHHPSQELPIARAIINPKQPDDPYPEKNLAGVGLAYKLACALLSRKPEWEIDSQTLA